MMTAGIAATSPKAVASKASAMPGATTARLVVCDFEMPMKLFMMPHTVPNNPMNGDVAPMVASRPMPSRIRRASARTISENLEAARSLIPASLEMPADSRASRMAAASNDDNAVRLAPRASCASASDLASLIWVSASRSRRVTSESSIILAMKMVHVTSEANASPIITALTTMSADRNIDQGDSSRSATVVDFTERLTLSEEAVAASAGAPATVAWDGAMAGAGGSSDGGGTSACCGAGACCANEASAIESIAKAMERPRIARKRGALILQPGGGNHRRHIPINLIVSGSSAGSFGRDTTRWFGKRLDPLLDISERLETGFDRSIRQILQTIGRNGIPQSVEIVGKLAAGRGEEHPVGAPVAGIVLSLDKTMFDEPVEKAY